MQASNIVANPDYLNDDFAKSSHVVPCLKLLLEGKKKVPVGTVLQLQSVINISVAKKAQDESRVYYDPAKHCLKFSVTDGSFAVNCYLFDGHPTLSDQTPPGTKLKFLRDIPFKSKALVFSKDSVEVIGGYVKQLVESWKVNKDLDRSYHVWGNKLADSSESGPPKWKEFNFRQGPIKIPILQNVKSKTEDDSTPSEFDQQRKANISRLTEQLGDLQVNKTFGEGKQLIRKDVLDIMKEGFTEEVAENAVVRFKTVKNALKHLQPKTNEDDHKSLSTQKLAQNPKKLTTKLLDSYGQTDDDVDNTEYERQKHNTQSNTLFDFVKQAIPKTSAGQQVTKPALDTQSRNLNRGDFDEVRDNYQNDRYGSQSSYNKSFNQTRGSNRNYNSYDRNRQTQFNPSRSSGESEGRFNNSYNENGQPQYDSSRNSGDFGRGRAPRFNNSYNENSQSQYDSRSSGEFGRGRAPRFDNSYNENSQSQYDSPRNSGEFGRGRGGRFNGSSGRRARGGGRSFYRSRGSGP